MPITPADKEQMRVVLQKALAIVADLPEQRPCALCDHFVKSPYCEHWHATVPLEAQDAGCEAWFSIPF